MNTSAHITTPVAHSNLRKASPRRLFLASAWIFAVSPALALAQQITGTWEFKYQDVDGNRLPVRLSHVQTHDEQPDGGGMFREIGPTGTTGPFPYIQTGLDGKITATLQNFEAGGIDPRATVLGRSFVGASDVEVFSSGPLAGGANPPPPGIATLYVHESAVTANQNANFVVPTTNLPDNTTTAGHAFAALDAAITGNRYRDHLGGAREYVDLVFPTNASGTSNFTQTIANHTDGTSQYRIHLRDETYSDWDVILHEYGHAVSRANNFRQFSGSSAHSLTGILDVRLSWDEGFSNYYQSAAQDWENAQTGDARLPNVKERAGGPSIRDTVVDYIDDRKDFTFNLETRNTLKRISNNMAVAEKIGPGNEMAVARLLWDLMDSTGGAEGEKDQVAMGHKGVFELLTTSVPGSNPPRRAINVREFEKIVEADVAGDAGSRARRAAIFSEHGIAPEALKAQPAAPAPIVAPLNLASAKPANPFELALGVEEDSDHDVIIVDEPGTVDLDPDYSLLTFGPADPPPLFEFFTEREGAASPTFRLQFFRELPTLIPDPPTPIDLTGPTDHTPGFQLALIDTMEVGAGTPGALPDLRSFQPSSLDWLELLGLAGGTDADPAIIAWNILGQDSPGGDDGVWSNALRFRVVPEPSVPCLVMAAAAWLVSRRRHRR